MPVRTHSALKADFFARPATTVAESLIGKRLVCGKRSGIITEVEAYDGPEDKACHGSKGLTERTKVMFGPAGQWYVYFIYGMYWMLNIVTGDEGYPAAVLIRGVEDFDGPGKLTKAFGINKRFNGVPATEESGLWIEEGISPSKIKRTPRIGVDYAGAWAKKPYRFILVQ